MSARVHPPVDSRWKMKAIIALDPAGVQDSGIAVRLTAPLPEKPLRGKLRTPDWEYQGSIWNDVMFDDLGVWLAKYVGRTGPVLLAIEDCAFRSLKIARSIGTAIGALRGFLVGTGWVPTDQKTLMVTPGRYREYVFRGGGGVPKGRDNQKAAAIQLVQQLYGHGDQLQADLAEAILLNDFVVGACPKEWQ